MLLTRCGLVGRVPGAELYRITKVLLIPLHATPHQHEAALDIAKLLSSGFFYFSYPTTSSGTHYTLLASMQQQTHPQQQFCWYVYIRVVYAEGEIEAITQYTHRNNYHKGFCFSFAGIVVWQYIYVNMVLTRISGCCLSCVAV